MTLSTGIEQEERHRAEEDILVYLGEEEALPQPETFRLCPLGAQLFTGSPMEECTLIDLKLSLPGLNGAGPEMVQCTGLVAQCKPPDDENPRYQVWVKFLDMPQETLHRIEEVTRDHKLTCPYCANF